MVNTGKSGWLHALRLVVPLVLLGGGLAVFLLNRNIDPRFYLFLQSRTGQAVAQIMGWSVEFELPPPDIPESEMTEEELAVKRDLERIVRQGRPTHQLVLNSGEKLTGKLLDVTPTSVQFMESYGSSGVMAARIGRGRIRAINMMDNDIPPITYRDVRLKMEFPDFEFYLRPPYTVITDENYFHVQHSVLVLRRLHASFGETFGSLITRPERGLGIQLLFFEEEDRYREYANAYAPLLEHTSGFYSPKLDRLTVFNQITSGQLKDAKQELKRRERLYRRQAENGGDHARLRWWRSDAERIILRHAEEQTRFTMRHEGTHQLLFTYGIHSTHHAENSWLIEGIPVYCEGATLGELHRDRVALLKEMQQAGKLIPLADLVNSRSPRGLFVFGGEERVHLAYSQSWVLVHFLMQPKYRNRFFNYIRYIRDIRHLDAFASRPRIEVLAETLGMDAATLDQEWQVYVQRM